MTAPAPTPARPRPTPHQHAQIETVLRLLAEGRPTVLLTGPGGVGKTFCLCEILDRLEDDGQEVAIVAPTGKAARRAQEATGRPASTIHSFVYQAVLDEEDDEGNVTPAFRSPCVPAGRLPDVLVVDEGSMVGSRMARDLEIALRSGRDDLSIWRRTQILVVGDPHQIPPVKDTPGFPLYAADAKLTEVLRQAADSPVLRMATRIRQSADPSGWLSADDPDDTRLRLHAGISVEQAAKWFRDAPDRRVILTYTNATRKAVNRAVRAPWAADGPITDKDRVVVTMNDSVFVNGDVLDVEHAEFDHARTMKLRGISNDDVYAITVRDPVSGKPRTVRVVPRVFGQAPADYMHADGRMRPGMDYTTARNRKPIVKLLQADYGACLTVHKSQGSQWPEVMVLLDGPFTRLVSRNQDEARRLLYTAVTRASDRLIVGVC